jgi:hypothetical protein
MNATLTLDLFRPPILDPVEAGEQLRAGRRAVRDRVADPVSEPVGGDLHVQDLRPAPSDGPTLDDLVVGVWEDLTAHRTVACLACGEAMVPRYSAGPAPVGGRCHGCGTTIR